MTRIFTEKMKHVFFCKNFASRMSVSQYMYLSVLIRVYQWLIAFYLKFELDSPENLFLMIFHLWVIVMCLLNRFANFVAQELSR
jgi:hypothetical protein